MKQLNFLRRKCFLALEKQESWPFLQYDRSNFAIIFDNI